MVLSNVRGAYQKTSITTCNPIQLVVLCYDKSINDLELARKYHACRDFDKAYERLRHANKIISELLFAIDYEAGGEIAVNLSRIYSFILREFAGINSSKDAAVYDDLIKILAELRSGWEAIGSEGIPDAAMTSGPSQSMTILA